VSWLWLWQLGLGKLAILDGDPGLGKSLVALDLCARLSTGRPFPDGSPGPGPASSIVLNGEDGEEDTIGPRLESLGADLDRVFVLGRGEDESAPLRFPAQVDLLEAAIAQAGAKLVVIDPILAFFLAAFLEEGPCTSREIWEDPSARA
jgi:RecA-family ATPase